MNTLSTLGRKNVSAYCKLLTATIFMLACAQSVMAAKPEVCNTSLPEIPGSLKCTSVPEPYTIDSDGNHSSISPSIIKNKAAAIALGKMLFWDAQVGSDGIACASCHFQAGADNRIKNQINPGFRNASGKFANNGTTPIGNVFDFMASYPNLSNLDPLLATPGKGPNYTLKKADFPLRQYKEPETPIEGQALQADRNAEVIYDSDDIISSQGAYHSTFNKLTVSGKKEKCTKRFPTSNANTPFFNVKGYSVRQVPPRNTPSVINAVYNFRNFWDGRANNIFNGLDPFGMRRFANPDMTPGSDIYVKDANGKLVKKQLTIYNASLASQAVGPVLNDVEMSCGGKEFVELGKKMLNLKPLSKQKVDPSDSVLASYTKSNGEIKPVNTYKSLVQAAFNDAYWNVPDKQTIDGYKLMENNFSLFWGLAVQAYEATLVSDDSRFDRAQEDPVNENLTEQEQHGLQLFLNEGKCVACHLGSEFTAASVTHVSNSENTPDIGKYVERMIMGHGEVALYDSGFYNIGVRPSEEDLGVGESDPYGFPLSFTRNAKKNASNDNLVSLLPDFLQTDSALFSASIESVTSDERDERDAIDGAFKTPTLRNIELTGPYFHNGGQATLEQVVQFYNRGGDRKDSFQRDSNCGGSITPDPDTGLIDSTGFLLGGSSGQPSNLAADMAGSKELLDEDCQSSHQTLKLSNSDVDDLVAFMKTLTDERVRWEKAPFDHPSLTLSNGHKGDENKVKFNPATNQALEDTYVLPAVGAAGRQAKGLPALQSFDSGLK